MDWGGVMMNKFLSRDNRSRHPRYTTDMFEIASGITNQTAIQCVALTPNNLDELPIVELDFLKQLPTTWDETRFIDGYPGRYVVLARRHGTQWYIAALNALKEPLTLTLNLTGYGVTKLLNDHRWKDGSVEGVDHTSLKPDRKGRVKVTVQPNGGLVIW